MMDASILPRQGFLAGKLRLNTFMRRSDLVDD
jgi:hypothetical protein